LVNGTVSYWVLASAYGLVNNPEFSVIIDPLSCSWSNSNCESYLLPGGLQTIIPKPPESDKDPVVAVHGAPSTQLDFLLEQDLSANFSLSDCAVYGDEGYIVGIELCIAESESFPGSVIAG
jgi:hypothetical protein